MVEPDALLLLPRIRVQNANAISSPLTWGFPAPTAFCGFVHALHRKLSSEFDEVALDGTAIICHAMQPQVSGRRTKVFSLSRNPVDKDGVSASLVEEGRTHLEISLVIGISGDGLHGAIDPQVIADRAHELTMSMRIAGGSVLVPRRALPARDRPTIIECAPGADASVTSAIVRRVLPGFALVSREGLLDSHWASLRQNQSESTLLDALLDLTRANVEPPQIAAEEGSREAKWHLRARPGWLVPIPVGFAALSELYAPGEVKNARDRTSPFRFVEGLLSLGQWLSPHRVADIRHALWQQDFDARSGIYRCTTPHYAGKV